jgi:hypothetical protein
MEPAEIDTTVPQSARIWNYWLGGKDNYAVDRAAGDEVLARIPDIADGARAERAFLMRVVRFLVQEAGIRQFLDVGTGLPTENNTHEVATGWSSWSPGWSPALGGGRWCPARAGRPRSTSSAGWAGSADRRADRCVRAGEQPVVE